LPLRVVRVMPESRQALLFDRNRSTHVLAQVGRRVAGYTVEDIDDESVTLRRGSQQIVLAAPPRRPALPATAQAPAALPPTGQAPALTARPMTAQAPSAPTAHPTTAQAPSAPTARPTTAQAPSAPIALPPTTGQAPAAPTSRPATTEALAGAVPSPRDPDAAVPADPYASGPADPYAAAAPADPYADPPVRSAEAPDAAQPGGAAAAEPSEGVRVARAPSAPGAPSAAVVPGDGGVRVAQAPPAPSGATSEPSGASGTPPVRVVEAPAAGSTTPRAPAAGSTTPQAPAAGSTTPQAPTAGPTPVAEVRAASAAPSAAPTSAPDVSSAATISRAELDRALADFAALTAAVHASFSAAGVVVESVGAGTVFQRAGLRAGDVIASVDGIQLRSLDDAANLYARAATAKVITAQVMRAGKPVTLRMAIR
jgi:PDZ domain